MTTEEFFIEWLEGIEPTIERSTYEGLTIYVYKHIIPEIGKIPLDKLTTNTLQDYLNKKAKSGRLDGKSGGLSSATLKKHLSVMRQAFGDAIRNDYLTQNPARYCRIKRTPTLSQRVNFLSLQEAKAIINKIDKPLIKSAFIITLYYGLRRSELLGLKWSAINTESNTITISHTVVKNLTIVKKENTKTFSSVRTYPILPEIKKILAEIPHQSEYIFPIRPDTLTRTFQRQLLKYGFPKIRFHDIRHSTASILFEQNWALEDVKAWLGHTDIETTSNIYIHYTQHRKVMLSNNLQGLIIE